MLLLAALIGSLVIAHSTNLPKTWKTCKQSDPNLSGCLKDAITIAVTDLVSGNPSLGVMPIDPIHINKFVIKQGSEAVSINLDLTDVDATGLKSFQITSFDGDWKTMKMKVDLPNGLDIKGKYKINGKILMLPIKGEGPCIIKFYAATAQIGITYSEKQIKGKTYYNVEKFDFDSHSERFYVKFDNLFGGDKALSDNMNKFLNENSKMVDAEIHTPVNQGLAVILKQISQAVFSKLTKDQITPP